MKYEIDVFYNEKDGAWISNNGSSGVAYDVKNTEELKKAFADYVDTYIKN